MSLLTNGTIIRHVVQRRENLAGNCPTVPRRRHHGGFDRRRQYRRYPASLPTAGRSGSVGAAHRVAGHANSHLWGIHAAACASTVATARPLETHRLEPDRAVGPQVRRGRRPARCAGHPRAVEGAAGHAATELFTDSRREIPTRRSASARGEALADRWAKATAAVAVNSASASLSAISGGGDDGPQRLRVPPRRASDSDPDGTSASPTDAMPIEHHERGRALLSRPPDYGRNVFYSVSRRYSHQSRVAFRANRAG